MFIVFFLLNERIFSLRVYTLLSILCLENILHLYCGIYKGTDDSGDEFWFLLSPVLSRQQALTMLQVGEYSRNKRKGIINECCKRPCSVDHLKQYCGDEEE